MAQNEVVYRIVGESPLLMHNGAMANPLNPLAKQMKEITGLRKKTDEHHIELQRLEFRASLYLNEKGQVIIPSANIEGTIIGGAKKSKLGTSFKSAVMVLEDPVLEYGEQLTVDELWAKHETYAFVTPVIVNNSRVMRTRPRFINWALEFSCAYDDEQINREQLTKALRDAGKLVGLCDYRPKFGRFSVVSEE